MRRDLSVSPTHRQFKLHKTSSMKMLMTPGMEMPPNLCALSLAGTALLGKVMVLTNQRSF